MPRITRGRTGCLTCRKRRKKCDEAKPSCENCQRSGYICEGYQAAVRYSDNQSRTSESGRSSNRFPAQIPSADAPAEILASWFLHDEPSHAYSPAAPFAGLNALQGSAIELCTPRSDIDTDDLDATYQAFLSSQRLTEPGAPRSACTPRPSSCAARSKSRLPRSLPFLIDGIETASERQFFMHFTNTTSRVVTSRTDDTNPLMKMLLPLSLNDSMVRKAILSVGASHLGKLQPFLNSSYMMEKGKFLRAAENEQIQRIEAARASNVPMTRSELDAVLGCTLVLCLYEVSEGSGDLAWQARLEVARDLVQNALDDDSFSSNEPGQRATFPSVDDFLLEFFVYHDVLGSVTDPARTPILTSGIRPTPNEVDNVSYMMGVDDGLFDMVARAAALHLNQSYGDKISTALSIWEELDRWEPSGTEDQRNAGLAYIHAIFVWIYLIVHPQGVWDEKVRNAVDQGWANMEQIQGNGVMAFLLFPTFVLGFTSITSEERERCGAQFGRLKNFSGFGNVGMAYDLVKQSWLACNQGMPRFWDWVEHMQKKGVSLLVT